MAKPQPGEIWADREGFWRGPLMAHNNGYYSLTDGAYTWKGDGSSLNPWEESPRDLIRRISPPEYAPGVEYPWTGGECPVPGDTLVEVWFGRISGGGSINKADILQWKWRHDGKASDIIAFKIITPEAPKANPLADACEAHAKAADALAEASRALAKAIREGGE